NFPEDFAKIRFGTKEGMAGYMKLASPDHDASHIPIQVGVGIKPVSNVGTIRLVKSAIRYALKHKRRSVTIVHKGNIMKFTEGAFKDWGYGVATREFRADVVTERESWILGNKEGSSDLSVDANARLVEPGYDMLPPAQL